jgi:hypothetical protein
MRISSRFAAVAALALAGPGIARDVQSPPPPAPSAPAPKGDEPAGSGSLHLDAVPIDYALVGRDEYRVPIGESVRAETWDRLAVKPDRPVTVRMACVVWMNGQPGACVNAALVPPGQKTVDWKKIRERADLADRSAAPMDVRLRAIAGERIGAALVGERPKDGPTIAIRIFEEVISPADARAPFREGDAPLVKSLSLTKPVDRELAKGLHPAIAIRHGVNARVTMVCRITAVLRLLCREPGTIEFAPGTSAALQALLTPDLRRATYQFATLLNLLPTNKDGEAVAGRAYRVIVGWRMPE